MSKSVKRIAVVGSVNLDLVARVGRLPRPGETVTGAELRRYPGGKGANQALAARRLGAEVSLYARVGEDGEAEAALALLRAEQVDLEDCRGDPQAPTGIAMILVDRSGENQIVVAPGANAAFRPERLDLAAYDAVICQLEVPDAALAAAAAGTSGLFCINLAPFRTLPRGVVDRADLLVMNEGEAQAAAGLVAGHAGLQAITLGAAGARLCRGGQEIAAARPPRVEAVDATAAGDAFTAALVLELTCGRPQGEALAFACAAGAATASRPGAQPSLPDRAAVLDLLASGGA